MPKKIETDASFGVIPFRTDAGRRLYLLVRHRAGHWGFPKGHAHAGEDERQTALRELAEETAVTECRLLDVDPLVETYRYTKRSGRLVEKTVTYFLGHVTTPRLRPRLGEISDCAWGDAEATAARLTFDDARSLLARAESVLESSSSV